MRLHIPLAATLCAIFLTLPFGLAAQNTAKQESRRAQLEKEIAQIEKQLKENSRKSSNALNSLSLVRKKVSNRKALVAESDRQIKALDDSIASRGRKAAMLQARLDTFTLYYNRLVHNAYKNRDARVWYMYLLSSESLSQAVNRYSYLRSLSSTMNTQATRIQQARTQLSAEMDSLGVLRANAAMVRESRARDLDNLRKEERQGDKLVAELKKDKKRYQSQLNTKKKQVEALNKEIERIIAQAMAEAKKAQKSSGGSSKTASRPIDYKLSGQFESNKGKLPWPADGPVVEKFGRHNHPIYTNIVMPANNGIDIGLSAGDPVLAVFDGEVRKVIVMPGYNKCVLVQHGGYFSFYCKLGDVSVKAGDKVKTGGRIGTVASIGNQTQLHFEVWKETTPQNPESWLRPR